MKEIRITVLIPMKGHSERVANKNLKTFCGRPLYHAISNELLKNVHITNVLINTDSDEIAMDICINFPGFIINERPIHLIGDFVPMNDIIKYDLEQSDADIYVQTHSTNPLLRAETLAQAIRFFVENREKCDSLFSVTRLQTRLYWKDGQPINHNPAELLRTQDLPPVFEENSCLYIFTKESFKNAGNKRIGVKPYLFEIDKIEAMDIDEPEDFVIAEQLYKLLRSSV
jgi:N-acylneuraminate cytidylyltransferase